MRILSFHAGAHDVSAAAFEDYKLVAAVAEERLTRLKNFGGVLPWLAIDEVLRIADWTRRDVEVIAATRGYFPNSCYRVPLRHEMNYVLKDWFGIKRPHRDLTFLCRRFATTDTHSLFRADRFLADNGFLPQTAIHFVNHHEAHALPALFYTDWDDALLYTSDGFGDNVSFSMRLLRDGRLDCFYGDDRWLVPAICEHGLARTYGYATIACGYRELRHEGKLVGLAARGEPKLAEELAACFHLGELGVVKSPFNHPLEMQRRVFEICRGHDHATIAASIQKVTEEFILRSVRHWLARTGTRHLALSGGLFANVRLNRLLAEATDIDEIFIYPAMGDEGLSVGAGLSYLRERDGLSIWLDRRRRLDHVYLGRDYDGDIDRCLAGSASVRRLPGSAVERACDLLVAGRIGAIYSGRMEFGPRALGARSIIASPGDPSINDRLNQRLDRSEFMPFAPSVLAEDAAHVFEVADASRYALRFMTITCAVKPEWRVKLPAIVHLDGTARPQVLDEGVNPLFASLLRRFREVSGLPVLINTSFNVHEEPIIDRPSQCLQALLDCRIDFVLTRQAVYTLE